MSHPRVHAQKLVQFFTEVPGKVSISFSVFPWVLWEVMHRNVSNFSTEDPRKSSIKPHVRADLFLVLPGEQSLYPKACLTRPLAKVCVPALSFLNFPGKVLLFQGKVKLSMKSVQLSSRSPPNTLLTQSFVLTSNLNSEMWKLPAIASYKPMRQNTTCRRRSGRTDPIPKLGTKIRPQKPKFVPIQLLYGENGIRWLNSLCCEPAICARPKRVQKLRKIRIFHTKRSKHANQ